MAFKSAQDQAPTKYAYQRYPLVMHRGQHPNIESCFAHSAEDEAAAIDAGWSLVRPSVPEPEPEKPVISVEDRLAALEDAVAELTAAATAPADAPKRGPGRPKKEHSDAS